ncbi:MAG TPA: N-acetylmuramoyl-L-alanine amidase, partial [bacterium]|nr:N-acetylmuramoyl-L-alanine amidase [bacterium]
MLKHTGFVLLAVGLLLVSGAQAKPVGCIGGAGEASVAIQQLSASELQDAFASAAKEFGVPVTVLQAVARVESNMVHAGPTCDYGYGIMHLVDNSYCQTLKEAAALVGLDVEQVKSDPVSNIRAGAALIAKYAKETVGKPKSEKEYFDALKGFSGLIDDPLQESQAAEYFKVMGIDVSDLREAAVSVQSDDYGPAIWNPADPSNYDTTRGGVAVDRWVNHWIGVGTYAGAISWFKNPSSNVSAHFVVRASDGELTQMVRFAHRAWHCGYWNSRSIGIEHEAISSNPGLWNSVPMLTVATDACRYVCNLYGFPKTRTYIVGHKEVPYASTDCPGPLPWDTYMNMVNNVTSTPTPGAVIIIDDGDATYSKSGSWSYSTCSTTYAYNGDYDWIGSTSGASTAWAKWTPSIGTAGDYRVYVMYRNGTNRAIDAPYTVVYNGGSQTVDVNQQQNGGVWVLLGT